MKKKSIRPKNYGKHSVDASSAPKPSRRFFVIASIEGALDSVPAMKKIIDIELPCTLSDLAFEVANAAFNACEELCFKASIEFLPAREISIEKLP